MENSLQDFCAMLLSFMVNSFVDLLVYCLVESLTRSCLNDRTIDKQDVFNFQVIIMFVLCWFVWFHHVPYLLLAIFSVMFCTLICTSLPDIYLRLIRGFAVRFWDMLANIWEDYNIWYYQQQPRVGGTRVNGDYIGARSSWPFPIITAFYRLRDFFSPSYHTEDNGGEDQNNQHNSNSSAGERPFSSLFPSSNTDLNRDQHPSSVNQQDVLGPVSMSLAQNVSATPVPTATMQHLDIHGRPPIRPPNEAPFSLLNNDPVSSSTTGPHNSSNARSNSMSAPVNNQAVGGFQHTTWPAPGSNTYHLIPNNFGSSMLLGDQRNSAARPGSGINPSLQSTFSSRYPAPTHPTVYVPQRPRYLVNSNLPQTSPAVKTSLSSMFWNTFFPSQAPALVPLGLANPAGKNLCFFNSALQLMARTSGLAESIARELKWMRNDSPEGKEGTRRSFIIYLSDILVRMSTDYQPRSSLTDSGVVLSTDKLRTQAAALCKASVSKSQTTLIDAQSELIASPNRLQRQQDVQELLLWLMDEAHSALNTRTPKNTMMNGGGRPVIASTTDIQRTTRPLTNTSAQLSLKFSADKSTDKSTLERRRQQLASELEQSVDQTQQQFLKSLLELSDIDWQLHMLASDSLIDDFFSIQSIFVNRCNACLHCSAPTTQLCRILSIPMDHPDININQPVTLEKCISLVRSAENMTGANCSHCTMRRNTAINTMTSSPSAGKRMAMSPISQPSLSTLDVMSPIPGSTAVPDGGSPISMEFTASTPISTSRATETHFVKTDFLRVNLTRFRSNCLVLHLMRFRSNYSECQSSSKLETMVTFQTGLDLSDLTVEYLLANRPDGLDDVARATLAGANNFELYAFCCHIGKNGTDSGHYKVYARDGVTRDGSEQWWLLEDETVKVVDINYLVKQRDIQKSVYLLCYRKHNT